MTWLASLLFYLPRSFVVLSVQHSFKDSLDGAAWKIPDRHYILRDVGGLQ
jgi:hypothetical protein